MSVRKVQRISLSAMRDNSIDLCEPNETLSGAVQKLSAL
jgi:hypothetical protein